MRHPPTDAGPERCRRPGSLNRIASIGHDFAHAPQPVQREPSSAAMKRVVTRMSGRPNFRIPPSTLQQQEQHRQMKLASCPDIVRIQDQELLLRHDEQVPRRPFRNGLPESAPRHEGSLRAEAEARRERDVAALHAEVKLLVPAGAGADDGTLGALDQLRGLLVVEDLDVGLFGQSVHVGDGAHQRHPLPASGEGLEEAALRGQVLPEQPRHARKVDPAVGAHHRVLEHADDERRDRVPVLAPGLEVHHQAFRGEALEQPREPAPRNSGELRDAVRGSEPRGHP